MIAKKGNFTKIFLINNQKQLAEVSAVLQKLSGKVHSGYGLLKDQLDCMIPSIIISLSDQKAKGKRHTGQKHISFS